MCKVGKEKSINYSAKKRRVKPLNNGACSVGEAERWVDCRLLKIMIGLGNWKKQYLNKRDTMRINNRRIIWNFLGKLNPVVSTLTYRNQGTNPNAHQRH